LKKLDKILSDIDTLVTTLSSDAYY